MSVHGCKIWSGNMVFRHNMADKVPARVFPTLRWEDLHGIWSMRATARYAVTCWNIRIPSSLFWSCSHLRRARVLKPVIVGVRYA
jgi:hypothetical protein